jgi:hypothetical protein
LFGDEASAGILQLVSQYSSHHSHTDGSHLQKLQPAVQYSSKQHLFGDEASAGMLQLVSQYSSQYDSPADGSHLQKLQPAVQYSSKQHFEGATICRNTCFVYNFFISYFQSTQQFMEIYKLPIYTEVVYPCHNMFRPLMGHHQVLISCLCAVFITNMDPYCEVIFVFDIACYKIFRVEVKINVNKEVICIVS